MAHTLEWILEEYVISVEKKTVEILFVKLKNIKLGL